jgi:hypothetical protein
LTEAWPRVLRHPGKRKGVFPDASFSKELVKLPVDAFVEFLDEIVDDATKKQVRDTLVKDKQMKDKTLKGLAIGVLTTLGQKFAGEVGKDVMGDLAKPIAEKATGFITALLSGDVKGAFKAKDEIEV